MNLWVKKGGLIFISALIFFSCEEKISTIGLPPENDLGIFFAELPLKDKVTQVWVDSINSRSTENILVGQYDDPYFGHIEAKNYSEVNLPTANPGATFDGSAVFDSLVLELRIGDLAGINDQPLTLEVYQLTDKIELIEINGQDTTSAFYFTSSSQALGQKLGESTFIFDPDSVGLQFSDTSLDEENARDSAIKSNFYDANEVYIYLNRFKLDQAFGQMFFDKMKNQDTEFKGALEFADYFKGLGLVSTQGNTIATYQASSTYSKMIVYFSETKDGVTTQKTVNFSFNNTRSYNNISPNRNQTWSGSQFDQINTFYEPYVVSDNIYIQNGTGLFTKLDLSFFRDFRNTDSTQNAVIERAQLIIKNPQDWSDDLLALPNQLLFSLTTTEDLAKGLYQKTVIPEALNPRQPLTLVYDTASNSYRGDIPLFLRNLDHGFLDFDQVIITPLNFNRNVNRLVVRKEDVKIEIFYTLPETPGN